MGALPGTLFLFIFKFSGLFSNFYEMVHMTSRVVDPDPDPDWIRIQSGLWIRIRNPDPDPGGQK
jgi:hypothetical protein